MLQTASRGDGPRAGRHERRTNTPSQWSEACGEEDREVELSDEGRGARPTHPPALSTTVSSAPSSGPVWYSPRISRLVGLASTRRIGSWLAGAFQFQRQPAPAVSFTEKGVQPVPGTTRRDRRHDCLRPCTRRGRSASILDSASSTRDAPGATSTVGFP